jgi:hypothetical protein
MNKAIQVSALLPSMLTRELIEAAKTPIDGDDGFARTKEIERVTQRIKLAYPQYFRGENETYHSVERARQTNKRRSSQRKAD